MKRYAILAGISLCAVGLWAGDTVLNVYSAKENKMVSTSVVTKSDSEWEKEMTPEQFKVMRKKGTERPNSGTYVNNHAKGVYQCSACKLDLYSSDTKFESGTGWPSFWAPINPANVKKQADNSLFSRRTEILCPRCGSHLGHVFDDGPAPTHERYCMNSVALFFVPADKK